ncbi:MAG: ORF6N domain-containing protein [Bacteroidales bacterium]|nr:ORF6N domain-containing protein [Bacteroidales bacterium]
METNIQIVQPQIIEFVSQKIYKIRGLCVMIDYELAELYGVETRTLNQAVKRNLERFPPDFMFQLSYNEAEICSRSQFVILNKRGSNIKYLPHAFTEQGVAMLSSVLRSSRAIDVNIAIMRAFVEIRKFMTGGVLKHPEIEDLRHRIQLLEKYNHQSVQGVEKHETAIAELYALLTEMINQKNFEEKSKRRPIGFIVRDDGNP